MNREAARRAFVRNMVVGLPALAGAAAFPPGALAVSAPGGRTSALAAGDLGIEAVLRRMARLHNDMLRRGPSIDDARVVAAHLRDLVTYRRESGRDREVSLAFRELIAERGRRALTAIEPDRAVMQGALVYYGMETTAVDFGSVSQGARLDALEKLARDGAESYFLDPVMILASLTSVLEAEPDFCKVLHEMMKLFEAMAATMCVGAVLFPPLAPECFAASVSLAVLKIMDLFAGC